MIKEIEPFALKLEIVRARCELFKTDRSFPPLWYLFRDNLPYPVLDDPRCAFHHSCILPENPEVVRFQKDGHPGVQTRLDNFLIEQLVWYPMMYQIGDGDDPRHLNFHTLAMELEKENRTRAEEESQERIQMAYRSPSPPSPCNNQNRWLKPSRITYETPNVRRSVMGILKQKIGYGR